MDEATMQERPACPGCGTGSLDLVARLGEQPAVGTVLYATREEALDAPSAPIDVGFCARCGLLRNLSFDDALVGYDASYENSLHFSPRFESYIAGLARRLVDTYGLARGAVAEIGSGKGEFLATLCEAGAARAYGYDPSYDGEIDDHPLAARVEHVPHYVDLSRPLPPVDLICCRHVLEHFAEPAELLVALNRSQEGVRTPVYVEVPNGEFVLSPSGMWDFVYQHVSYFTAASLEALFDRCGFDVVDLRTDFDGQFLAVEAVPARAPASQGAPRREVESVGEQVRAFAETYERSMARWRDLFSTPQDVVLWGAGAKGVTFLNTTAARTGVRAVVDVNPRKQGSYVAGTGQPIIAPGQLVDDPPATVLVMNPAYRDEIGDLLASLDLTPEVTCV